ncbi:transglutaminase family protein [Olsenella profusa]|uniref:Transglutaminase family protein n=1 Tax=Olsenella profusa TaxID=138595 RepID=A0ABS2F0X0_9ACTN|nr:transglutaminase family protein [Olsenella profusa]MBM6774183.1 transglutaminase family protein [Olsenella profusa]
MRLTFDGPVTEHRFQLRCVPATRARQQVVDVKLEVDPPCHLDMQVDSFSSVVATGYLPNPHDHFSYAVTGIAFVDVANAKSNPVKPLYRFDTPLTTPGPAVSALVEACRARIAALGEGASVVARASEVMHEVYAAFAYTPGSTTVETTAEQALAQGRGVCQDYAHVMLAVCRHVGLTARYIAGMLDGEGATHAWVEVYDERGVWVGLDPTHDRPAGDSYIVIGHGRDYRDTKIDIGLFSGAYVNQTQWVNASVHEVEL